MGWHSTWDKAEWSNEDVKYVLADLCNAINERLYILYRPEVYWPTNSGNSLSPSDTDFVGVKVTGDVNSWSEIAAQISYELPLLLQNRFFDSGFTGVYSWSEILTFTGHNPDELSANLSWRKKDFYVACKDILSELRYIRVQIDSELSDVDIYTSLDGIGGGYSTPEEAWENATTLSYAVENATRIYHQMAYDSGPGYHDIEVKTVPTSINFTYSLRPRQIGANLITFITEVEYIGSRGNLISIHPLSGSFAGTPFTTPGVGIQIFTFSHTDASPTLQYSSSCPFFDDVIAPVGSIIEPSVTLTLHKDVAHIDINPLLNYK